MLGKKYGMTDDDWLLTEKLGLKKGTVLQRLQKYRGDKTKALQPLQQAKRNQLENLGKARSTRLPKEYDQKLIELAVTSGQTISDLIAKAVIKYLGD